MSNGRGPHHSCAFGQVQCLVTTAVLIFICPPGLFDTSQVYTTRSCSGDLRIKSLRDQCCFHSCSFVILHQCYVVIRTGVKNAQMYPPSRRTTAFHIVNYILSIDISVSGQSGHYQSPFARFDYLIQLIKSNVVSCRSVGA